MAIPHRVTITCPSCGVSEALVIANTSVGPHVRVREQASFALLRNPLWCQTVRDSETFLSCTTCGTAEFTTPLRALADMRGIQ